MKIISWEKAVSHCNEDEVIAESWTHLIKIYFLLEVLSKPNCLLLLIIIA